LQAGVARASLSHGVLCNSTTQRHGVAAAFAARDCNALCIAACNTRNP
jgi:hypothetical protein